MRWFAVCAVNLVFLTGVGFAQTSVTLVPTSLVTTHGDSPDPSQNVSNMDIQDQSGSQYKWDNFVEFTTASGTYAGYRTYTVPYNIAPASISSIQVKANFQGRLKASQTWTWSIYNWSNGTWVTVGDNANSRDWGTWVLITFQTTGTLANYVRASDRQIRIQWASNNQVDVADLDYEAVVVKGTVVNANWTPPAVMSWDWTITFDDAGHDSTMTKLLGYANKGVQFFDIDGFYYPQNTAADVQNLRNAGAKGLACYVDAGTYEDWRADASSFTAHPEIIGTPINPPFNHQWWVDIRRWDILGPIEIARMQKCKNWGFDVMQFDDVNGWELDGSGKPQARNFPDNNTPLTFADQLTYDILLLQTAKSMGMGATFENDPLQMKQLQPYADWVIIEECERYSECSYAQEFSNVGKAVFADEYTDNNYGKKTSNYCSKYNTLNFNAIQKERFLHADPRTPCRGN